MRERSSYPGKPRRAMLRYFANIITFRLYNPDRQRNSDLVLVQAVASEEYVPPAPWQKKRGR